MTQDVMVLFSLQGSVFMALEKAVCGSYRYKNQHNKQ